MNSTRARSARPHSQQNTAAAGKYEYLRVRCRTAHSLWWTLTTFNFYGAMNWRVIGFSLNDDFNQSYYKMHFCSEVYVGSLYSTILKIVTKNCTEMMRIAAHFQLLDKNGRMRWWCMVTLTQFQWLLLAWMYCAWECCVLRLTPIYNTNVVWL